MRNGRRIAGPDRCAMTQCVALRIFTARRPEPQVLDSFAGQRLCPSTGGWLWDGNLSDGWVGPGPVEAQGMGMLGESKMARFGWNSRPGRCIPY